jgi:hypothetical protein
MTAAIQLRNTPREILEGLRDLGDMLFAASIMILGSILTMVMFWPLGIAMFVINAAGLIHIDSVGMFRLTIACMAYFVVWGTIGKPDLRLTALAAAYAPLIALALTALAVIGAALNLVLWAIYWIGSFLIRVVS